MTCREIEVWIVGIFLRKQVCCTLRRVCEKIFRALLRPAVLLWESGSHNPRKWIVLGDFHIGYWKDNFLLLLASQALAWWGMWIFASCLPIPSKSSLKTMWIITGLIPWNRIAFIVEQMESFLYWIIRALTFRICKYLWTLNQGLNYPEATHYHSRR